MVWWYRVYCNLGGPKGGPLWQPTGLDADEEELMLTPEDAQARRESRIHNIEAMRKRGGM